eukprot:gnl/MRDRNA2_/MRDRNA2_106285_c0_seq1.p1 gnl/MRDRNA2_/MRDRNA2_106285_c0~~gnl/MRDRNA2_/MRDRNA2_106285_c0_seq1.p1  ORF type:complete len:231 (+),score=16.72 gnl/MRDRNA2_/MRDRNA2_106285_c0_seq1:98-694(+)
MTSTVERGRCFRCAPNGTIGVYIRSLEGLPNRFDCDFVTSVAIRLFSPSKPSIGDCRLSNIQANRRDSHRSDEYVGPRSDFMLDQQMLLKWDYVDYRQATQIDIRLEICLQTQFEEHRLVCEIQTATRTPGELRWCSIESQHGHKETTLKQGRVLLAVLLAPNQYCDERGLSLERRKDAYKSGFNYCCSIDHGAVEVI